MKKKARSTIKKQIQVADLFCGAGGTSAGLLQACAELGIEANLLAVNHWPTAIATHSKNHPEAKHLCMPVDKIRPEEAVPGGRLHLLVASPECTHHSLARGGKPMSDQSRSSAWDILNWAQKLYVDNILIENVKEFRNWGPLGANNRPMKSKVGATYRMFIETLKSLGYNVEARVLNAADYGAATTRERLFVIARRGNKRIVWPEPTHARKGAPALFGDLEQWRPARDIIDWDLQGQSIFDRKKPLADSTLRRIEAGLRKFGGRSAEPFLVVLRNHMNAQSLDEPLPALAANGTHMALCEPFLLGQQSGSVARSVGDPCMTISTDDAISLVEPFLVAFNGTSTAHSIEQPLRTATSHDRFGVVEPFVMVNRNNNVPHSVDEPVPTLCTGNHMALIEPFIVPQFGGSTPRSIDRPLGCVTTTSRGVGLCEPHATRYGIDIRFRMLQVHELGAAMSFPKDYEFTGNKADQVKQIGNAVDVRMARALGYSILAS